MIGNKAPIIIIGAGLSGLSAALTLKNAGQEIKIFESSDEVGGRVRTDRVEGFLLDRGFQVLLKSYPEARRFLDYSALDLRPFLPGARVLTSDGNYLVMDPSRKPAYTFETLFSPIGTLRDKFKLLELRLRLARKKETSIFENKEITTLEYLSKFGFSEKIIQQFFIPFLGGIFLENKLITSSRVFEFVYQLFGSGDTVVPAKGMGQIPLQMAKKLGPGSINFNEKVLHLEAGKILTEKGEYNAKAILFAGGTLHNFPAKLPELFIQKFPEKNPRSAYTLYFTSPNPPLRQNIIVLNSFEPKWVNTLAVMDRVSDYYAPRGKSLLAITLDNPLTKLSIDDLAAKVKDEMKAWFPEADSWNFLKAYSIPYALPDQDHVSYQNHDFKIPGMQSIFHCGDYIFNGSINAALRSGRLAGEQILREIEP